MPHTASFRIPAVANLLEEIAFAPDTTRRRQMDAAEQLIEDLDSDLAYPFEFVVYRVTGYRSEPVESEPMLVGEALRADLVTFVQSLSRTLDLSPERSGRRARTMEAIARRLGVSKRTLHRWRRLGLVCHFVRFDEGAPRLACYEDRLARFLAGQRGRVHRAARYRRLSNDERSHLVEAARTLRHRDGLTLHATACRLAARNDLAPETVRRVLLRYDGDAPDPIFPPGGPLTGRDAQLIERAMRRGVAMPRLRSRFGRTGAAILKAVQRHRAQRLSSLALAWGDPPASPRGRRRRDPLKAPGARLGLPLPQAVIEVSGLLESARSPSGDESMAEQLAAYHLLKGRAAAAIERFGPGPSARALDRVETDLRWAAVLKERLVEVGLPGAVGAVEQGLDRPIEALTTERILGHLAECVSVVSRLVEILSSHRGDRFRRRCAQAMDLALAQRPLRAGPRRAAARHDPGTMLMLAPFEGLVAWDWLRPDPRWLGALDTIDDETASVVRLRFGWDGAPPRTCAEIAAIRGVQPQHITRRMARAIATMARCVRAVD